MKHKPPKPLKGRSLWTQEQADIAHEGPHYPDAPYTARSRPQSVSATPASEAVTQHRWSARGTTLGLTTLPPRWRKIRLDELSHGGARLFARHAEALGFEVAARRAGDAEQVGIRRRRRNALWMRATWISGTSRGVAVGAKLVGVTEAKRLLADKR